MDVSVPPRASSGPWPRPGAAPPAKLAVLVVSADAAVRAAAARQLETKGYAVTCARHSGHALLACLTRPRIDVAVIDVSLEEMPGPELAERLRRYLPDLRVVFLASPGTRAAAGVVVRPLTADNLIAELEALTLTAS